MTMIRLLPLSLLLLAGGCAYDYAGSYAPEYPPGYDSGMGSGQYQQPGDLFGGQNVTSIEVFYGPLSPHGRWVDSRFGRAFQPAAAPGWRPYVNGRWGEDRLWISDDPWGWATDHYGRWGHDDRLGWVWMPDTQWAPSWVAWREDDSQDVAGWAPIPPGVNYSIGVGFGGGYGGGYGYGNGFGYDDWNNWYGPGWIWVPRQSLYQPGFGGSILPWSYGRDHWRNGRWNDQRGWNNNRPDGWNNNNRPGGWNANNRPNGWDNNRPGGWNANTRPDGWNSNRPGGWDNNRPGNPDHAGRTPDPRHQGRPGTGVPVGGSVAALPSPNNPGGYRGGYPGGNWQGRPREGRPESGQWQGSTRPQGRPPGQYQGQNQAQNPGRIPGQYQGLPRGQYQGTPGGQPPRVAGNANPSGGQRPVMAYRPPPSAPPPRAAPPSPRSAPATIDRSAERPD